MPFMERFMAANNKQTSQFPKHGNASKSTSEHALTMASGIGS